MNSTGCHPESKFDCSFEVVELCDSQDFAPESSPFDSANRVDVMEVAEPLESPKATVANSGKGGDFFESTDAESPEFRGFSESAAGGSGAGLSSDRVFYRCQICSYQTQIQYLLARHVAKHELDRPYQCPSCDFSDFDNSTFVNHWASHQNSTKILPCPFCSFKANHLPSLEVHIPKHRPVEMLDCSMCEFSTNYVHIMKSHFESFHTKVFKCDHCSMRMTKHELTKHVVALHSSKVSNGAVVQNASPRKQRNERSAGRTFVCSTCKFVSKTPSGLQRHELNFHKKKYPCAVCGLALTRYVLIKHSKVKHDVVIGTRGRVSVKRKQSLPDSPSEQVTFDDSAYDEQPLESATVVAGPPLAAGAERSLPGPVPANDPARTFKCPICSFTSRYRMSLTRHLETLHKLRVRCDQCPAQTTKYGLLEHSMNMHGDMKKVHWRCSYLHDHLPTVAVRRPLKMEKDAMTTEPRLIPVVVLDQLPSTYAATSSKSTVSENRAPEDPRKKFKCSSCSHSTTKFCDLQRHKLAMHGKKHACRVCSEVMTRHELIIHSRKEHGIALSVRGRTVGSKLVGRNARRADTKKAFINKIKGRQ